MGVLWSAIVRDHGLLVCSGAGYLDYSSMRSHFKCDRPMKVPFVRSFGSLTGCEPQLVHRSAIHPRIFAHRHPTFQAPSYWSLCELEHVSSSATVSEPEPTVSYESEDRVSGRIQTCPSSQPMCPHKHCCFVIHATILTMSQSGTGQNHACPGPSRKSNNIGSTSAVSLPINTESRPLSLPSSTTTSQCALNTMVIYLQWRVVASYYGRRRDQSFNSYPSTSRECQRPIDSDLMLWLSYGTYWLQRGVGLSRVAGGSGDIEVAGGWWSVRSSQQRF